MLIDDQGHIEGSVTGGCIEGALVDEARSILAGAPPRVATYGISDDQAVGVGLMCGGTVRVFVNELRDPRPFALLQAAIAAARPVALATMLDGPCAGSRMVIGVDDTIGTLGHTDPLDTNVAREARGCLDEARSVVRHYGPDGQTIGTDLRVAINAFATPARMIIFGANDFSASVAQLATQIGHRVTIVDARRAFIESPRFSANANVVVSWPQDYLPEQNLGPRDAVLVFTHDSKFDEPALLGALDSDVGYIGALGSRRTVADRQQRLRDTGVDNTGLQRINSPCGLDLGARTPNETAIASLAEILVVRTGHTAAPLATTNGPIHPRAVRTDPV